MPLFCVISRKLFHFQDLGNLLKRNHQSVLLYDGVHLLAKGMEQLFEKTDLRPPNVNCSDGEERFSMGKSIYDEINQVA